MSTAALDSASAVDASEAPLRGPAGHGRMCVVCRRKAATDDFVQLKQVGLGAVVAEGPGGRSGRSAYVCIALACLQKLHQKTLDRALKNAVVGVPTGAALLSHLHTLAQARLLSVLGLARRCGELLCGVDQVQRYLPASTGFFVMADDLAPRSARKLADAAVFLNGQRLGQAVGMGSVGAMGVRPGRLARQAAYWFRLWYETGSQLRPTEQELLDGCVGDGNDRGFGQRHQLEKPIEVA